MVQSTTQVGLGIACAGSSALFFIAALVTTHWGHTKWQKENTEIVDVHVGLFEWVAESEHHDHQEEGLLVFVIFSQIVGLVGGIAGWGLGTLVVVFQHNNHSTIKFHLFAAGTLISTDVLATAGYSVFTFKCIEDLATSFGADVATGYSFYISVFASVLGLFGGYVILRGGREESDIARSSV